MTERTCDQLHCIRRPTLGCRKCSLKYCGYHAKLGGGAGATKTYCPKCGAYMYPLAGDTFNDTMLRRVLIFSRVGEGASAKLRLVAATTLMDVARAFAYCTLLQGLFTGALDDIECSAQTDGMIASMIAFDTIDNAQVLRRHTDWAYSTDPPPHSPPSSSVARGAA
jgi:hypothetical protein